MKFIYPNTKLLSSNITITESNYVIGATYSAGNKVYDPATTNVYEKLETSGVLASYEELSDATKWLNLGVTNKFKMFDDIFQSQTVSEVGQDIVVTIKQDEDNENAPATVTNSIALFNLYAKEVTVVGVKNSVQVYNKTFNLKKRSTVSPCVVFNCAFGRTVYIRTLLIDDLPLSCEAIEYTVTIKPPKDDKPAKVGICQVGYTINMGVTLKRAALSTIDYSVKETNEFGEITVTQRAYTNRLDATIVMPTRVTSDIWELLDDLRATPLIWIPTDKPNYRASIVYGIISDKRIVFDNVANGGICDQQLEINILGMT